MILLEPPEEENEMQNPSITLRCLCRGKTSQSRSFIASSEPQVAPETGDIDELAAINTKLFKSESSEED